MTNLLSISTTQQATHKQRLKQIVGQALAAFLPSRTTQLFNNPLSEPENLRDRLLMSFLKNQAIKKHQTQFFERLHKDFWVGAGGESFAENCDHRFEDLFLAKQQQDFKALQSLWKDTRPDHIVEIGCNSGLLLNYLSTHLPDVKSAVGIDINHNQIQANRNNSRLDSRIEFVCGDGCDWIIKNAKPNSLFVTNGGVLEYFQRQRLDQLLTYLDQNLSPAYFFSIEPVATDHDWNEINESIPFGEELSFSHNYRDLFQSNGFQILHQRPTEFERWQMFTTLAQSVKVGSVLQQRLES